MKRRIKRALYIAAILATGILLLSSGRGGLAHFSPHTLEYTAQSEFTILGGAIPIYRSCSQRVENELVTFIQHEGFVAPDETGLQRWEGVFHWNDAWRDGEGMLYDVFHRRRRAIIEWSKADRERASIYWSEGFKDLRSPSHNDNLAGQAILQECWRCETISELKERIAAICEEVAELD